MLNKGKIKTSLDIFLANRGIERNNFHLNEKSILLQKIINMKRNQKNNSHNFSNYKLYNNYANQNTRRKICNNKLIKRGQNNNLNNLIYNNYVTNFSKNIKPKKEENKKFDNWTINCNYFSDTFRNENEKNEKEYIFHTSTKPLDVSNESILNRINRTNNDKSKTQKNFRTSFKPPKNKLSDLINTTEKKFIYKKKIQRDLFRKKFPLSRNKLVMLFGGNNSKENSICNSIDFSIINRTTTKDKNYHLSKTSESFYIISNRKSNKSFHNKNSIHIRNIKFMNHFVKYCYLYYIIIVKKFFNNLKSICIDNYSNNNISNLLFSNKNSNIFEEFNRDDFDRETIKNKTTENFFDGCSLSFISNNIKNKKEFVYNRHKRIIKQNYQMKNLMKLLDNSKIENEDIPNFEEHKFNFDNEQEKNNNQRSPFFYGKNSNNNLSQKDLDKKKIKSKNSDIKDNIIGFIQVNNEINPFKIKNNTQKVNFFNEQKNILNEDEILSFRKKNSEINKILTIKTNDNKLNIDIKYLSFPNDKKSSNKSFDNNKLKKSRFYFMLNNNNYYNKRIKKISLRVKNSRIIKEKEDYVDLNNNENMKKYLYSLSVIKEEDDEKYNNDSSIKKPAQFKKFEPYFNISNNSKLYTKTIIEKLIDGENIINEEDIDKILNNKSSSRYKINNKKSQEITVVSNFGSVMRNKLNRKENAKALINGILILIKFFGSLCFNIRKNTFYKIKMNWKMRKFITYIIKYGLKKTFKNIKNEI